MCVYKRCRSPAVKGFRRRPASVAALSSPSAPADLDQRANTLPPRARPADRTLNPHSRGTLRPWCLTGPRFPPSEAFRRRPAGGLRPRSCTGQRLIPFTAPVVRCTSICAVKLLGTNVALRVDLTRSRFGSGMGSPWRIPSVPGPVDMTRSASRRRTTAVCALRSSTASSSRGGPAVPFSSGSSNARRRSLGLAARSAAAPACHITN